MSFTPRIYYKDSHVLVARNSAQATALVAAGFEAGEALDLVAGRSASGDDATRGAVTAPALPASTVAYAHDSGRDAAVNIVGGTVTAIVVDGVATGLTSGTVIVPAGRTIAVTYSVAPTWVWTLF